MVFVVDVPEYAEQTLSRQSREALATALQSMVPSVAELKNTGADQVIAHVGRAKRSMNTSMLNRNPILYLQMSSTSSNTNLADMKNLYLFLQCCCQ